MGFSVPAAFIIISVAAFYAVGMVLTSVEPMLEDLLEIRDETNKEKMAQLSTKIEIAGIKTRGRAFRYDIKVKVINRGSTVLDPSKFDILIGGLNWPFDYSPKNKLYPLKSTIFRIEGLRGSGWHQIKIISENGAEAYGRYRIR
ncbi:MAG TPA: hypothetical protein HA348_05675 [Thermoplasmata archaeon]|nr:hypothetical protein [Thermoplasmata archaeon]